MLAEEALILRDDQQPFPLAETRRSNDDFCRWRAGAKHLSCRAEKEQQTNSQDNRHADLDLQEKRDRILEGSSASVKEEISALRLHTTVIAFNASALYLAHL